VQKLGELEDACPVVFFQGIRETTPGALTPEFLPQGWMSIPLNPGFDTRLLSTGQAVQQRQRVYDLQ